VRVIPPAKPPSATFAVERHVGAPRDVLWLAACAVLDEVAPVLPDATQVLLSDEAPWRRVYDLHGSPFALFQLTLALQDHDPESHFVLGAFIELGTIEPDEAAPVLAAAQAAATAVADTIVGRAHATVGSTKS
jgi:hypothetical protein